MIVSFLSAFLRFGSPMSVRLKFFNGRDMGQEKKKSKRASGRHLGDFVKLLADLAYGVLAGNALLLGFAKPRGGTVNLSTTCGLHNFRHIFWANTRAGHNLDELAALS